MQRDVIGKAGCCSIKNIKDVQNAIVDIEYNLPQVNKAMLSQMLNGFVDISKILVQQEAGIFQEVIKWCRLYLDMHISIDPKNSKLLEQFENTAPSVITYIIGYLQFQAKEIANYHYCLLQVIASILQNLPQKVLQYGFHFEPKTVACVWKPIDLTGDFNVQLLTLQIFLTLVKYLEDDKRYAVLNSCRLNSMDLVKDKLNIVIQETALISTFEENCDRLWIDLNLRSEMLTFKGRFRYGSDFKAQQIDVSLKVQEINLEKDTLYVHVDASHSITSPVNIIADNGLTLVKIHLSSNELKCFNDNPVLMSYIEQKRVGETTEDKDLKTNNEEDTFDKIRNETPISDVKNKPLNQIAKSAEKCCKYPFDSPSTKKMVIYKRANFSTNPINLPGHQYMGNAFDPLNIPNVTPVSTILSKTRIKHHSIIQLRSKKRLLSQAEDYIPPNKQRKKNNKKCSSSSAKTSGRKTNQKNKQLPMKTPEGMYNMLPGATKNLNAINILASGDQCDVGRQHSTELYNEQSRNMEENVQNHHKNKNYTNIDLTNLHKNIEDNYINNSSLRSKKEYEAKGSSNKEHKKIEESRNDRLADNDTSSLKISATDVNNNNRLQTYKYSAIMNSDEFSLKSQSFKKPIECARNRIKPNQLSPENITEIDSNERTENICFPDCEEVWATKYNSEEPICTLPKVCQPSSDIGGSAIDLTLETPTNNFGETIISELTEKHEFFDVPSTNRLLSVPETPASSTTSDINDFSCFVEFENEESHLINRILNDWETDSNNDDNLEKIKGLESNLKTTGQNNRTIFKLTTLLP